MKEEKKKTKKFNKKYLAFGILGLFALALVSAIAYFSFFTATFNVTPLISVDGAGDKDFSIVQASTILGDKITLTNNGGEASEVVITSKVMEGDSTNVDVSYVGTLVLAKKTIINTVWTPTTDTITIEYTLVGDTFEYDVIDGTLPKGYVLVYAMDKDERFTNYATVMKVEDVVSQNLPLANDWNAGEDADYCASKIDMGYTHCKGAKVWAIPSGDISTTGNGDGTFELTSWNNMWDFYWETDLVEFNKEGQITVYPNEVLNFTPVYDFDKYANGTYVITTEIK